MIGQEGYLTLVNLYCSTVSEARLGLLSVQFHRTIEHEVSKGAETRQTKVLYSSITEPSTVSTRTMCVEIVVKKNPANHFVDKKKN